MDHILKLLKKIIFYIVQVEEQTERVIKNIEALLKEAGASFKDVIKTTCFLDDMNNFSTFNEIYAKYFISNPARSCVQAVLPKGAKVEIEVIAYTKSSSVELMS